MCLLSPQQQRLLTLVVFVYKLTSCSVSLISFSNVSNMTWGDSSCLTCWRTGTQSPRALIIYWNKLGWEDINQGPTAYLVISGQWNRGLILHHVWFKITKITKHSVFDVKTIVTPTKIAKLKISCFDWNKNATLTKLNYGLLSMAKSLTWIRWTSVALSYKSSK